MTVLNSTEVGSHQHRLSGLIFPCPDILEFRDDSWQLDQTLPTISFPFPLPKVASLADLTILIVSLVNSLSASGIQCTVLAPPTPCLSSEFVALARITALRLEKSFLDHWQAIQGIVWLITVFFPPEHLIRFGSPGCILNLFSLFLWKCLLSCSGNDHAPFLLV